MIPPAREPGARSLRRSINILLALRRRRSLAPRDICSLNDCDRQTVRRDMERLAQEGVPVRRLGEGRDTRWTLDADDGDAVFTRLGFADGLALEFGRQMLGFLGGTEVTEWHDELRDKIVPLLPRAQGERLSSAAKKLYYLPEPARDYAASDEVLDRVLTALFQEHELVVRYAHAGGRAERWERFQPLTLVIYRRALYLLGRAAGEMENLVLAVERIVAVERGEGFTAPREYDPELVMGDWFGVWRPDRVETVVLRFPAERAHLVRARRWHRSQVIREIDGGVELRMRTGGRELVRFCLEWGPMVEVVEPGWLREAVIAELRAALGRYGG